MFLTVRAATNYYKSLSQKKYFIPKKKFGNFDKQLKFYAINLYERYEVNKQKRSH